MSGRLLAVAALALGLLGTAAATRVVEQPEGAYELQLGGVVLPSGASGSVIFKPCSDCDMLTLRVSAETTYTVDGTPMEIADFLQAADNFRSMSGGNENTAVYVFYDVESERVNRLVLDYFGG